MASNYGVPLKSLGMTLKGHSRLLKMVPLETLDTVSYAHSIATMAVSLAVSEILSVK